MLARPHRNNTDFQLRHFVAGGCFTADAAWMIMYEQKLDIETKLVHTKANILRHKIKKIDLDKKFIDIKTEKDKLNFEADLMEWEHAEKMLNLALQGGEAELSTIVSIMEELEPLRKYSHLPLLEANEASQREEWLEDFKHRIENYLLTMGTIPEDQITAMRKHPDFETNIVPYMKETIHKIAHSTNNMDLLTNTKKLLIEHEKDKTYE